MNALKEGTNVHAIPSLTIREVIDGFASSPSGQDRDPCGSLWDLMEDEQRELRQRMVQFILENPGKSYNAIFNYFKKEGFNYKSILETYNILLYDKKILQRINTGTAAFPRYAHFAHVEPEKDGLHDVFGPLDTD